MNKNTGIIIGLVIVAIVAGAAYGSINKRNSMKMDTMMNGSTPMEEKGMDMMDDEMMHDDDQRMMDTDEAMMKTGSYEEYAPEKLVRAETGDVVLFFHASWCPSCRGLNSDLEKNLSAIPSGLSILKVDYDSESELKKKYSITYQHTLVQVDASGALIKKWSGSPTLASLTAEIK